ncbi:MAG TPA: prephenate dehydratase [Myxococcales bacterium]|nr:prephenate dehydratase [Myxococcales bacterium]
MTSSADTLVQKIAFQGAAGAFSHLACSKAYPKLQALPCASFVETFDAVESGAALYAMIPVENSRAGRVADIHHLLPERKLFIVREHFQPVAHHLVATHNATLGSIRTARSHVQALSQCRNFLLTNGIVPTAHADTAAAAAEIAELNDPTQAAIASSLAARIYNLQTVQSDIQDSQDNTTRFCILSRTPFDGETSGPMVTTLIFHTRSVPAALYKAMGGFATNGVNITKLESYILDGSFAVAQFYMDFEGCPGSTSVDLALEELAFYSHEVKLLGSYPAAPFRQSNSVG